MISPKRFDIPPPLTGECSEDLDAFRFFFKNKTLQKTNGIKRIGRILIMQRRAGNSTLENLCNPD